MDDPRLVLILAAVFAPVLTGIMTLFIPREVVGGRTLVALAGPVLSVATLLAFVGQHDSAPSPLEAASPVADSGARVENAPAPGDAGVSAPESDADAADIVGVPFAPSLEIDLTFNPDRLGVFFAMLVAGVGVLIVLYARAYFGPSQNDLFRFFPTLGLFTTAMLGLVLADNMLALIIFWELTSVASFLLIGWNRDDRSAVRLAMQALVVTGLGGLALLGGVLLLAQLTDTWSLREAISVIAESGLPGETPILLFLALALIFLGGATKSAQWPFHFWLPGAMAAPTPVSAYLHSATMVKAGVYLFARLFPALGGNLWWSTTLLAFGAVTMLLGAFLALRSNELKRIFAYTTVSQLGLLVAAYALGRLAADEPNLIWPVTQILNHALYKAPLFILAGAIAHVTGRKYLSDLRGLIRSQPIMAATCLLAAYALAGLPLTLSFVAKEAFLTQIAHAAAERPAVWGVGAMAVLTAACNVAIFTRFAQTFLARPTDQPAHDEGDDHAHVGGFWGATLWWPAALLVALQLLGGLAPPLFEALFGGVETHREYWSTLPSLIYAFTHPGPALYMSIAGIALGFGVGFSRLLRSPVTDPHDQLYPGVDRGLAALGAGVYRSMQPGNFRSYVYVILTALLVGLLAGSILEPDLRGWPATIGFTGAGAGYLLGGLLLTALTCLTALALPIVRSRIVRVLVLGTCGFSVVGLYLLYQAPDLALTQLMFEIISVVLFLLVLRMLPEEPKLRYRIDRVGRAAFASLLGLLVGWIVLHAGAVAEADEGPGKLGEWFLAQSYTDTLGVTGGRGGGGDNVVNVILVDFRGWDTLGEITVLTIAIMGVLSLITASPRAPRDVRAGLVAAHAPDEGDIAATGAQPSLTSTIFKIAMRLLLPLALIFAGYVFFKGHNAPGGGFIAGLVTSVALAVHRMAEGPQSLKRMIPVRPGTLAVVGLAIAMLTGLIPLLLPGEAGGVFLQSYNGYIPRLGAEDYHWASAMLFDIGVLIVVVAVSVGIINRLTEELE